MADNKHKCVIYCWYNKINGASYVGSTVNFYSRFYRYFNVDRFKNSNILIYNALLKYGLENFELHILEYCDRGNTINREQYYLDLIKPVYNILKKAGSSLGFKHNISTLEFFRNTRRISDQSKKKLSLAASKRVLTESERRKLSDVRTGTKMLDITRKKISESTISNIGVGVVVKDIISNQEKLYSNMTEAAKDIGVTRPAVKKACVKNYILKKRYNFRFGKY